MSTQQVITQIQSMPLPERVAILEALVQSIKHEMTANSATKEHLEEIRRRRREFKIKGFHLGSDVVVDRDEMYTERGL
jgi:hypothetical protein